MTKCLGLSSVSQLNASTEGGAKNTGSILSGFSNDLDALFEKYNSGAQTNQEGQKTLQTQSSKEDRKAFEEKTGSVTIGQANCEKVKEQSRSVFENELS